MQNLLNSNLVAIQESGSWVSVGYISSTHQQIDIYLRDLWGKILYPEVRKPFREERAWSPDTIYKIIQAIVQNQEKSPVLASVNKLSEKAKGILGANGLKRFETFKKYRWGWDGGNAIPLSNCSTAVMEYFINRFLKFMKQPSLFLTTNGNFQLGWENSRGQKVELEFFSDKIEFFIEALDEEGEINLVESGISRLISKLRENEY